MVSLLHAVCLKVLVFFLLLFCVVLCEGEGWEGKGDGGGKGEVEGEGGGEETLLLIIFQLCLSETSVIFQF